MVAASMRVGSDRLAFNFATNYTKFAASNNIPATKTRVRAEYINESEFQS